MALDFEPGLTAIYRTLEDCCAAVVYNSRQGVDGIAAKLDMSPSELSRRLNAHVTNKEGDTSNRPLRLSDLVGLMKATEDYRPIYWLAEKFCQDPDAQRTGAINQLAHILPVIQALVEQATAAPKIRSAA